MNKSKLDRSLFAPVDRRNFIIGAGAAAAGAALISRLPGGIVGAQSLADSPFTLGVASGDPAPDSVVLWTRLAPDPLRADGTGGMPNRRVLVEWFLARNENMTDIVQRGTTVADPADAHTVHVEPRGLEPARWYWYQFKVGSAYSRVGRTKTAPAFGASVDSLRFAFVSCQAWQDGFFAAYKRLAEEDLDFVVHLGDYIYEGGITGAGPRPALPPEHVRPESADLNQYRWRHSLYKLDPNLQAAHARFPFILTWDDHEVENNYAGLIRANDTPPGDFAQRRAAAYKAYYEHQPLRRAQLPTGPDLRLYRRVTFGNLAEFNVLDTRQYRDDQPCGDGTRRIPCAGYPRNNMLGAAQESWLFAGLDSSPARWNVLAQQIFMAQRDFTDGEGQSFPMDSWDGYKPARQRILDFIEAGEISNPVVLTGDVHVNWVTDLKKNFDDPNSAKLGSEFVGTSITSGGNGSENSVNDPSTLAENPHIKFINRRRGYVRCTLTHELWRADYRVLPYVNQEDAPVSTRASFVIENGQPGVQIDCV